MEYIPIEMRGTDYYPSLWEFAIILLDVVGLVLLGMLLKRKWTRTNDSVPIPMALSLWVMMFVLYFAMAATFYRISADEHKLTILVWCILFWMIPVAYYTMTVVNSLAMRTVDRIGPLSAKIEEPSEFAGARKLALRGDIDGAVRVYREYTENRAGALFEAARLLKSHDRFVEAALLLEEISETYNESDVYWTEAMYQLAKLHEMSLGDRVAAMVLLRRIVERSPESRFYRLALSDISRLEALHSTPNPSPSSMPKDPFYDDTDVRAHLPLEPLSDEEEEDTDIPIPNQDPFFRPKPPIKKNSPKASAKKTSTKKKATTKKKAATQKKKAQKKTSE